MARKMRDTLFQLADQPNFQVICTTHSPVFLDVGQRHRSIVRVVKDADRRVHFFQVTAELFEGPAGEAERERLRLVSTFHPTVSEVFFANRAVLFEEQSAVAAFERAAELTGLFARRPHKRRDVMLIDSQGKGNIPLFQRVLNHFRIPYTVIHDEDAGQPAAAENARIGALLPAAHGANLRHMISPANLETMLGYTAGKDKVYRALRRVEELHGVGTLPPAFIEALNWVYFGQAAEPPAAQL
jgi:predicted ATP-dependent endonuclease of OLD family